MGQGFKVYSSSELYCKWPKVAETMTEAKIPYWLVFGMGIGLLALIPFSDTAGMLAAAILVSFKSVLLGGEVIVMSLLTDQIIDNAVAPKILGDLVGLNPVWILLSLLVGAQLGGFLGLILAVPLAGSLKQILTMASPVIPVIEDETAQHP